MRRLSGKRQLMANLATGVWCLGLKARTDSTGCPLTSTHNTMAHTPLSKKSIKAIKVNLNVYYL